MVGLPCGWRVLFDDGSGTVPVDVRLLDKPVLDGDRPSGEARDL
jgi:hypothetical protein